MYVQELNLYVQELYLCPWTIHMYMNYVYVQERIPGGKDSPESGSLYSDYESGQQYEQENNIWLTFKFYNFKMYWNVLKW